MIMTENPESRLNGIHRRLAKVVAQSEKLVSLILDSEPSDYLFNVICAQAEDVRQAHRELNEFLNGS